MLFAFVIFKYFPYGGLQRDFLRIAKICQERGHQIVIYTTSWVGKKPENMELNILPEHGWSNHKKMLHFSQDAQKLIKNRKFSAVVGFNKLPGLDIYFGGDICYLAKMLKRPIWHRLTSRFRHLHYFEESVFSEKQNTELLILTEIQQKEFMTYYNTPKQRLHLLPPGLSRDRIPDSEHATIRNKIRTELKLKDNDFLILMIGSGFKTKGLDRAILAIHSLPEPYRSRVQFYIIGQDHNEPFKKLSNKLGLTSHIHFLGGREDVPEFMLAAELLIHPAYHEAAGLVLLEAMQAGLPVLTTSACGYSYHVDAAKAGLVVHEPFQQDQLNNKLLEMMKVKNRDEWHANAQKYLENTDVYSLPDRAADWIERVTQC